MSNLAGKAYALTVISPQWSTWLNRLLYAVFRCLPDQLGVLQRMQIIHFARWVILPADRWPAAPPGSRSRHGSILFASNFNNTWDVYLDEFSDILALGLDALWYRGIGFPGSVPSSTFKAYITHNSVAADYFYNATPAHGVRDIGNAILVRAVIQQLAALLDQLEADPALSEPERERRFREAFERSFRCLQNRLPTPGPAPPAQPQQAAVRARRRRRIAALEALRPPFGFPPGRCDSPEESALHAQL